MREYARQLGVRRRIIPVPFLTARLSSLWLGLVTPVYARVGRKLIDSLPHETVVTKRGRSRPSRSGLAATGRRSRGLSQTRIASSPKPAGPTRSPLRAYSPSATAASDTASVWSTPTRSMVPVSPAAAFRPIRRSAARRAGTSATVSGGCAASSTCSWAASACAAAAAIPRRRPWATALDFWRVEAYEPNRLLRLHAEMKLPGRAWLQFEVDGDDSGSTIRETAIFHPTGLLGTPTGTPSSPSTRGSSGACWPRSSVPAKAPAGRLGSLPGIATACRVRRLIRRARPRTEPCAPCRAARVAPPHGPRRDGACGAGGASPAPAGRGRTGR